MPLQYQPFKIENFSGGITDNFIDGPSNAYEKADNLILDHNDKLFTRAGSEIYSATDPQIPGGSVRINAMIDFEDTMINIANNRVYPYVSTAYTTLFGPEGDEAFTQAAATDKISWSSWNNHLLITNEAFDNTVKIYKDTAGDFQLVQAGLPGLSTSPTVTPSGGTGSNYNYAFLYYYEYTTTGNVLFKDFGATTVVASGDAGDPGVDQIDVSAIPVVANAAGENYDTANIKVQIYRTIDAGTTYYYVGEVTNGTTTYTDTSTDAAIQSNIVLYTDGGSLDNDPPPQAKYLHVASNICWYAHVKENGATRKNRIRQSVASDPDSCPASIFVDVDDEIVGINSIAGVPIVFCKNSIYRLEGGYDETGSGTLIAQRISNSVGCVSNNSIVNTTDGLFWAGRDGFYFCSGYNIMQVSEHLSEAYKTLVLTEQRKKNIYGVLDEANRRIYWGVQRTVGAQENDSYIILDLTKGIKQHSVFMTASGGESFRPTASLYFENQLLRADSRGYVFKHDEAIYTDPKVNNTIAVSNWSKQAIIFDFWSNSTSFGEVSVNKFMNTVAVSLKNRSNISYEITSNKNNLENVGAMAAVRYVDNLVWEEDQQQLWDDTLTDWGEQGIIYHRRRYPSGHGRNFYNQIRITNAFVAIDSSDKYGNATVTASSGTVVMDDTDYVWPTDAEDYKIAFEDDQYVEEFLITDRTDTTLTVRDINGTLADGSKGWVVRGYKKNETFYMLSYSIAFAYLTMQQKPYQGATGENA